MIRTKTHPWEESLKQNKIKMNLTSHLFVHTTTDQGINLQKLKFITKKNKILKHPLCLV